MKAMCVNVCVGAKEWLDKDLSMQFTLGDNGSQVSGSITHFHLFITAITFTFCLLLLSLGECGGLNPTRYQTKYTSSPRRQMRNRFLN